MQSILFIMCTNSQVFIIVLHKQPYDSDNNKI